MVLSKNMMGILAAALLLPGCVTAGKYYQLEDELARIKEELAYAQDQVANAEDMMSRVEGNADEVNRLNEALAAERKRTQELQQAVDSLGLQKATLAEHGLTMVSNAEEGMVGYAGKGDVFFPSGSDVLTKEGGEALEYIAAQLKNNDYLIRVDGHTDSDPIVRTKDVWKKGNIQLGAARAISVREKLVALGISEARISIASYGQFKPMSAGTDDASKARNRRVEIMMKVSEPASKR